MSFREIRSFTEIMKSLGYPRLISVDNFRLPNFELVADCLYWLLQRYYPDTDISDEISTEAQRVTFLQSIAQTMLTKARMRLNIKKLYAADGLAVRELLKLASLLYQATLQAAEQEEDGGEEVDVPSALRAIDVKDVKACAAEIVRSGAALYDALALEPELRDVRARAIASHLDSEYVERSVHEAISQVEDHLRATQQQLEEMSRTSAALDGKIDKRRAELERSEKRLATLRTVRPPYMDEYERLQGELQMLYNVYLDRFRNLEYLEAQLEQHVRAEQEKAADSEARMRRMQKRLADDELRILRGEQEVNESQLNDLSDSNDLTDEEDQDNGNNRNFAGAVQRQGMPVQLHNGGQMIGSLTGGGSDDDDNETIDEDTATDGGEVSMAGSDQQQSDDDDMMQGDGDLQDDDDDFGDDGEGMPESEDSGF